MRYEVKTQTGRRYRVEVGEGDTIEGVVAQLEADEAAAPAPSPAPKGLPGGTPQGATTEDMAAGADMMTPMSPGAGSTDDGGNTARRAFAAADPRRTDAQVGVRGALANVRENDRRRTQRNLPLLEQPAPGMELVEPPSPAATAGEAYKRASPRDVERMSIAPGAPGAARREQMTWEDAQVTADMAANEQVQAAKRKELQLSPDQGAAGDVALQVAKMAPTTYKLAANIVALAGVNTGALSAWADKKIADLGDRQTPEYRARIAELGKVLESGNPLAVVGFAVSNPMVFAEAIPSLPSWLLGGLAGKGTAKALDVSAGRMAPLAAKSESAAIQAELAGLRGSAATQGAVGSSIAMNAGSTFQDILDSGGSTADAYSGALIAGWGTKVVGKLTAGGAEGALARAGTNAAGAGRGGVVNAMLGAAGKEFLNEGGESLAQSAGAAVSPTVDFDPRKALNQATFEGLLATPQGAVSGAIENAQEAARSPERLIADAIDNRAARFDQAPGLADSIDGFARAALTPGSVLTDPNVVRPQDTVRSLGVTESTVPAPVPAGGFRGVDAGAPSPGAGATQQPTPPTPVSDAGLTPLAVPGAVPAVDENGLTALTPRPPAPPATTTAEEKNGTNSATPNDPRTVQSRIAALEGTLNASSPIPQGLPGQSAPGLAPVAGTGSGGAIGSLDAARSGEPGSAAGVGPTVVAPGADPAGAAASSPPSAPAVLRPGDAGSLTAAPAPAAPVPATQAPAAPAEAAVAPATPAAAPVAAPAPAAVAAPAPAAAAKKAGKGRVPAFGTVWINESIAALGRSQAGQPAVEPSTPEAAAEQQALDALNASSASRVGQASGPGKAVKPVVYRAATGPEGAGVTAARAIAAALGQRLVVVDADSMGGFNGVTSIPGAEGTIFVRKGAQVSELAVFGHELMHQVKATSPERYARLAAVVRPMIGQAKIDATVQRYAKAGVKITADEAFDELLNDTVGNRITDRNFWNFVAKRDKGVFRDLAVTVKGLIDRVRGGLRQFSSKGGETLQGVARMLIGGDGVVDMDAVRKVEAAIDATMAEVFDAAELAAISREAAAGGEPNLSLPEGKAKPVYTHEVVDPRTGKVMGQYQSVEAAREGRDRLDNEYGAYRYKVRPKGSSEPKLSVADAPGAAVVFEVAPDPNNEQLSAAWRGLPQQRRLDISLRVARRIVPRVLEPYGGGSLLSQVGSYPDDTNASFAVRLGGSADALGAAKELGFVLSQDSMVVMSLSAFDGGEATGAVAIKIGKKSVEEVDAIYQRLRGIRIDGEQPVGGQSYVGGDMIVLNFSGVPTDVLSQRIDEALDAAYPVEQTEVFAAFPEKKDYDYASDQDDGGKAAAALRQRARALRAEAAAALQAELDDAPSGNFSLRTDEEVVVPGEPAKKRDKDAMAEGFNPFRDVVDITDEDKRPPKKVITDEDYGPLPAFKEENPEDLQAQLDAEQSKPAPAGPGKLPRPPQKLLSSVGLMAEEAYPDLLLDQSGRLGGGGVDFLTSAGPISLRVILRDDGGWGVILDEFEKLGLGNGPPFGVSGLSEQAARGFARRAAASVDLFLRGHDLAKSVPTAAGQRVVNTWNQIAELPGIYELGTELPPLSALQAPATRVESLQAIADAVLADTDIKTTAETGTFAGWTKLTFKDPDGNESSAEVEYTLKPFPHIVAHTSELTKGSGAGKAFYQIAAALAQARNAPILADWQGLTGINTYRRTEQMVSAALRAGEAGNMRPGFGQRVYGWDGGASDAASKDKNLLRVLLASARNAAEIVPQVRDLAYNISTGAFTWRAGPERGNSAEAFVQGTKANPDVKAFSVSRSTLARAALTFQAIDGKLEVTGNETPAGPILYSLPVEEKPLKTDSAKFKRWFAESKIVDENGKPLVMYHGTAQDIAQFRAKQAGAIFVTPKAKFAESFADSSEEWMRNNYKDYLPPERWKTAQRYMDNDEFDKVSAMMPTRANIMPLYVKAEKPFDASNKAMADEVIQEALLRFGEKRPDGKPAIFKDGSPTLYDAGVIRLNLSGKLNNWSTIEEPWFQATLRDLGFDSFYVTEGGVKNLAVYDPTQLKSATGNSGEFDPANPDIRYSVISGPDEPRFDDKYLVPETPSFKGDTDGAVAYMPAMTIGGVKYEERSVRIRVGAHGNDKITQAGAQHRLDNQRENPTGRAYSTPSLGGAPPARVERAVRELALSVLTARSAYGDSNRGVVHLWSPVTRQDVVLRVATDNDGGRFWNVVTSKPADAGLMLKRYGNPSPIARTTVDGTDKQRVGSIAPGIQSELQDAGLFLSSRDSVIVDEDGLIFKSAAAESAVAGVDIQQKRNRKVVMVNGRPASLDGGGMKLSLPTPVWTMPEDSATERFLLDIQDSRVDLKRAQETIVKAHGPVPEWFDARQAETLFPGRVANRTDVFLESEATPLLQEMARNKVSQEELSDFLHARHAPEANAQIAKIGGLADGGAGTNNQGVLMTTAAARAYLAAVPAARKLLLNQLAAKVDAITEGTRDLLVVEGLEKQETIDAWKAVYKHYVPLFKDDATDGDGQPHPTGAGFTVKGSASKRRTGGEGEVTNMLAHVLMQREAAITRAEKNRVLTALYGQVLTYANPEFWRAIRPKMGQQELEDTLTDRGVDPWFAQEMGSEPTKQSVNKATGMVQTKVDPLYRSLANAVTLRVNGEDRIILFNAKDERALRMAMALKNLDGYTAIDWADGKLKWIAKGTRWFAQVNTQYNPAFGLVNVLRDTQGALVNLSSTEIAGSQLQVLGSTPSALVGIARHLRGDASRTAWSDLYVQFMEDGAQTGYRDLFKGPNDRAEQVADELKKLEKAGKLTPGLVAHGVLDLLDDFNTSLENAVRLSAYKAALDRGLSRPAAAKLARELTVDFNRKGRLVREVAPLYAFLNASIQGTARTVQALANGKTGAKIIAGGLALGVLQALLLAAAGFEDDEIPEFVKARALIIPTGGKTYAAIPLPLGLHVLPNTGRVLTEQALSPKDSGKKLVKAFGEIVGAFNPLGGGDPTTVSGALRTLAPTVLDPFIEYGTNRNFTDRAIRKETRPEDPRPGYMLGRESTLRTPSGQAYKEIARIVNDMAGGEDFVKGKASPAPEDIRFILATIGGGIYRELEKSVDGAILLSQGQAVPVRRIPLGGRFSGEVDADEITRTRYFANEKRIEALRVQVKGLVEGERDAELDKLYDHEPLAQLIKLSDKVDSRIAKINALSMRWDLNNPTQLAENDKTRAELMRALNEAVKELEKESAGSKE